MALRKAPDETKSARSADFTSLKRELDSFPLNMPSLDKEVVKRLTYPIKARAGYELAKLLLEGNSSEVHPFATKPIGNSANHSWMGTDSVCLPIEDMVSIIYVPLPIVVMEREAQRLGQPMIHLFSADDLNVFTELWRRRSVPQEMRSLLDQVLGTGTSEEKLKQLLGDERYQVLAKEYSKMLLVECKLSNDLYFSRQLDSDTELKRVGKLIGGLIEMYATEMDVKLPSE